MDEHTKSENDPYLNKYVTPQFATMAQRTAMPQGHLGTLPQSVRETQSAKRYLLDKKRITKFRGPW